MTDLDWSSSSQEIEKVAHPRRSSSPDEPTEIKWHNPGPEKKRERVLPYGDKEQLKLHRLLDRLYSSIPSNSHSSGLHKLSHSLHSNLNLRKTLLPGHQRTGRSDEEKNIAFSKPPPLEIDTELDFDSHNQKNNAGLPPSLCISWDSGPNITEAMEADIQRLELLYQKFFPESESRSKRPVLCRCYQAHKSDFYRRGDKQKNRNYKPLATVSPPASPLSLALKRYLPASNSMPHLKPSPFSQPPPPSTSQHPPTTIHSLLPSSSASLLPSASSSLLPSSPSSPKSLSSASISSSSSSSLLYSSSPLSVATSSILTDGDSVSSSSTSQSASITTTYPFWPTDPVSSVIPDDNECLLQFYKGFFLADGPDYLLRLLDLGTVILSLPPPSQNSRIVLGANTAPPTPTSHSHTTASLSSDSGSRSSTPSPRSVSHSSLSSASNNSYFTPSTTPRSSTNSSTGAISTTSSSTVSTHPTTNQHFFSTTSTLLPSGSSSSTGSSTGPPHILTTLPIVDDRVIIVEYAEIIVDLTCRILWKCQDILQQGWLSKCQGPVILSGRKDEILESLKPHTSSSGHPSISPSLSFSTTTTTTTPVRPRPASASARLSSSTSFSPPPPPPPLQPLTTLSDEEEDLRTLLLSSHSTSTPVSSSSTSIPTTATPTTIATVMLEREDRWWTRDLFPKTIASFQTRVSWVLVQSLFSILIGEDQTLYQRLLLQRHSSNRPDSAPSTPSNASASLQSQQSLGSTSVNNNPHSLSSSSHSSSNSSSSSLKMLWIIKALEQPSILPQLFLILRQCPESLRRQGLEYLSLLVINHAEVPRQMIEQKGFIRWFLPFLVETSGPVGPEITQPLPDYLLLDEAPTSWLEEESSPPLTNSSSSSTSSSSTGSSSSSDPLVLSTLLDPDATPSSAGASDSSTSPSPSPPEGHQPSSHLETPPASPVLKMKSSRTNKDPTMFSLAMNILVLLLHYQFVHAKAERSSSPRSQPTSSQLPPDSERTERRDSFDLGALSIPRSSPVPTPKKNTGHSGATSPPTPRRVSHFTFYSHSSRKSFMGGSGRERSASTSGGSGPWPIFRRGSTSTPSSPSRPSAIHSSPMSITPVGSYEISGSFGLSKTPPAPSSVPISSPVSPPLPTTPTNQRGLKVLLLEIEEIVEETLGWNKTARNLLRSLFSALLSKVTQSLRPGSTSFRGDLPLSSWQALLGLLDVIEDFIFYRPPHDQHAVTPTTVISPSTDDATPLARERKTMSFSAGTGTPLASPSATSFMGNQQPVIWLEMNEEGRLVDHLDHDHHNPGLLKKIVLLFDKLVLRDFLPDTSLPSTSSVDERDKSQKLRKIIAIEQSFWRDTAHFFDALHDMDVKNPNQEELKKDINNIAHQLYKRAKEKRLKSSRKGGSPKILRLFHRRGVKRVQEISARLLEIATLIRARQYPQPFGPEISRDYSDRTPRGSVIGFPTSLSASAIQTTPTRGSFSMRGSLSLSPPTLGLSTPKRSSPSAPSSPKEPILHQNVSSSGSLGPSRLSLTSKFTPTRTPTPSGHRASSNPSSPSSGSFLKESLSTSMPLSSSLQEISEFSTADFGSSNNPSAKNTTRARSSTSAVQPNEIFGGGGGYDPPPRRKNRSFSLSKLFTNLRERNSSKKNVPSTINEQSSSIVSTSSSDSALIRSPSPPSSAFSPMSPSPMSHTSSTSPPFLPPIPPLSSSTSSTTSMTSSSTTSPPTTQQQRVGSSPGILSTDMNSPGLTTRRRRVYTDPEPPEPKFFKYPSLPG